VVRDSGIGIPEMDLNKIFNRFFQSKNERNQIGTGIGLALTKELVKLHNGRIFVESTVGKGTSFTVCLPFYSDMEMEISAQEKSVKDEELLPSESDANIRQDEEMITKKSY